MAEVIAFPAGGYRFIKGPFQYSAGVAADAGFEIERARFVYRDAAGNEKNGEVVDIHLRAR